MDFIGPLSPIAEDGAQYYVLTISDYFTKWVEAFPTPNKCASGVANARFKVHTVHTRIRSLSVVIIDNTSPKYPWYVMYMYLTAALHEDGSSTSDHH